MNSRRRCEMRIFPPMYRYSSKPIFFALTVSAAAFDAR
jgi:hypothetical protein